MKIKKICFIGYGSHVEKTLIPSLKINKKNIKIISAKFLDNKFETFFRTKMTFYNIKTHVIDFPCSSDNLRKRNQVSAPRFHALASQAGV